MSEFPIEHWRQVPLRTFLEHPALQAILGEVPIAGGLATFWVETVRARREAATEEFLSDLVERLEALERDFSASDTRNVIDAPHVASTEYVATLAATTEIAVRDTDDEKRKYLLEFLVNFARERRPDISLRHVFLTFLRDLSGTHLALLEVLSLRVGLLSRDDMSLLPRSPDRSEVASEVELRAALAIDEDLADAILAGLVAIGLVVQVPPSKATRDRSRRVVISPLGHSLMRFLRGEW
jgi:hypothetical protein